jgi:hypothetical protein
MSGNREVRELRGRARLALGLGEDHVGETCDASVTVDHRQSDAGSEADRDEFVAYSVGHREFSHTDILHQG